MENVASANVQDTFLFTLGCIIHEKADKSQGFPLPQITRDISIESVRKGDLAHVLSLFIGINA
jgi:hypothetical protein